MFGRVDVGVAVVDVSIIVLEVVLSARSGVKSWNRDWSLSHRSQKLGLSEWSIAEEIEWIVTKITKVSVACIVITWVDISVAWVVS